MQIRDLLSNSATLKVKLGTVPYLEIGDVNIENKTYKLKDKGAVSGAVFATKNTILVSTVRPTRGAITIIKENSIAVSGAFVCLKTKESICLHRYLFYIVNAKRFTSYLGMNSKGATYPTCSKDDVLNFSDFNLPSISEQQSIVATLDKINELIDANKRQLELLDEAVKSRFVEMFGNPESNTKKYPMVNLSDIAQYFNGLTYRPENVSDEGIIVLRSSNIQNSKLDFKDLVRVRLNVKENKMVRENDILMCSRNGSAKLVGKVALIDNLPERMAFGAFMMIIRSEYYAYLLSYFQMDAFRRQITTGATTTINQITSRMLDNVKLPLPEMNEVKDFELLVKQIDKLKFDLQKHNELLAELLNKKMDEYFGGDM